MGRWCLLTGLTAAVAPLPVRAQTLEQLRGLSIEELGTLRVTSVLKAPESLADAPAAIYVITHDDIIRSGFTLLPDILRLAPNLEVAQLGSFNWQVSARGFNVADNASLSNKLLVLVDGRSVYSGMFGGVYWDMIGVLPENIDRIEVISGPGATLWGANAVNGVINVITLPASQTQGGSLTLGAGDYQRGGSLQYGGQLGPNLTYRVHGEYFDFSSLKFANGQSAHDAWRRPGGGFRVDWTPGSDSLSVQADMASQHEGPDGFNIESDALANWRHQFADGSSVQLLAYFDSARRAVNNGSAFTLNTYDVEFQHNFNVAGWNDIVWGVGERNYNYMFENTALALIPPRQRLNLANIFAQDTITILPSLKLTLGLKIEDEPYVGAQVLPSVRLAWKPINPLLLWAAVSRAVRSPTPVDVNLHEFNGPIDTLDGSRGFRPETMIAFELGTRVEISPRASVSVSLFYDNYDDLRSINRSSTRSGLPLVFGNLMTGNVYGIEAWGNLQVTDWWRLTAGAVARSEHFQFLPGAFRGLGLAFVADDPSQQAILQSSMNFGHGITFWADLREVGRLPHPSVPGYTEADARISWDITKSVQISLAGYNLLHRQHTEFIEPGQSAQIPRSIFAQTRLRF